MNKLLKRVDEREVQDEIHGLTRSQLITWAMNSMGPDDTLELGYETATVGRYRYETDEEYLRRLVKADEDERNRRNHPTTINWRRIKPFTIWASQFSTKESTG